jgi:flagellar basal body-associated protein FliL
MRLLEAFAAAFINTFGITQPTEATKRRAAWFILVMLVVTVCLVAIVGYLFYMALHR